MRLLGLTFIALLAACGGNGLGTADHCTAHADYASCTADPTCYADGCPSCAANDFDFLGCYGNGDATPRAHSCPAIACASTCSTHTDQASCDADASCQSLTCASCGPTPAFVSCADKGSQLEPICPAIDCPASCEVYTDLTSCEANPTCHAVFEDNPLADCASNDGSCLVFDHCDRNPVACTPAPTPAHSCPNAPACGTGYAPVYDNGCISGCVHAALCQQPDCTAHADDVTCEADPVCFAVFTGDEPCNSEGCQNHFSHCANAPATCSFDGTPECGLVPISCPSGFVSIVENGCVTGCARTQSCEQPD